MGYARVLAVALVGLDGRTVEVEADLSPGLPGLSLSGLPDAALTEARERVRAAVINSGVSWPTRRITLNLLPASLPKHGSIFDLALATSILCAAGVVPAASVAGAVLLGELGLDGQIRPVRGILPAVLAAARAGASRVFVPAANTREATLVPGTDITGVDTLGQLIGALRGELEPLPVALPETAPPAVTSLDLADVMGQAKGKRALEIAAAGGHNLAFFGPPGAGKTMLAERLPSLLPPLTDQAALEVTAVHSLAGLLPSHAGLLRYPPYQAPHHTSTAAAMVGGGSRLARPGAVSLAHHGVLFLDEAPEFRPVVLNALREPLESGWIHLARTEGDTRYPARVQLVLAANPCPCGSANGDCICSPLARRRYFGRLSGPLLDRLDLQVELYAVRAAELLVDGSDTETSATVRDRVQQARAAAEARWPHPGPSVNAAVPGVLLRAGPFRLPRTATRNAQIAVDRGALSARGYDRVLRCAWTLADLAGANHPDADHIAEAIALRTGHLT
jgi:magnesium chelatase family protein